MDLAYVWIVALGLSCTFVTGWYAGKSGVGPGGVLASISTMLAIGIVVIVWKLGVGHV